MTNLNKAQTWGNFYKHYNASLKKERKTKDVTNNVVTMCRDIEKLVFKVDPTKASKILSQAYKELEKELG